MKLGGIRWILPATLAVGFVIGLTVGVKTKSDGNEPASANIQERIPTRSKPRERDENISERSRIRALLSDTNARGFDLNQIESADIPLMLSVLAEQGGIKGIDYSERHMLQDLIGRWYGEDPAAAIAWIAQVTNPGDRQFYLESITGKIASKDIREAIGFMETHLTGSGLPIDAPHGYLNSAAKEGPEVLLRALLSTFDNSKSYSRGWSVRVEVPDGFDHKAFMDRLAATVIPDNSGRQSMLGVPDMMIRKWAEIDPNSAYEWLLAAQESGTSKNLNFHDGGISNFFEGYAKTAEPAEYGKFTASVFNSKEGDTAYRAAWDALTSKPDMETIDTFLQNTSPTGNRTTVLSGMLDISRNYSGGDYDTMRNRLFGMLTEQEQITYFKKAPQDVSEALTPILRRQGYTPEQIKGLKSTKTD